jgi:hypothetical protein
VRVVDERPDHAILSPPRRATAGAARWLTAALLLACVLLIVGLAGRAAALVPETAAAVRAPVASGAPGPPAGQGSSGRVEGATSQEQLFLQDVVLASLVLSGTDTLVPAASLLAVPEGSPPTGRRGPDSSPVPLGWGWRPSREREPGARHGPLPDDPDRAPAPGDPALVDGAPLLLVQTATSVPGEAGGEAAAAAGREAAGGRPPAWVQPVLYAALNRGGGVAARFVLPGDFGELPGSLLVDAATQAMLKNWGWDNSTPVGATLNAAAIAAVAYGLRGAQLLGDAVREPPPELYRGWPRGPAMPREYRHASVAPWNPAGLLMASASQLMLGGPVKAALEGPLRILPSPVGHGDDGRPLWATSRHYWEHLAYDAVVVHGLPVGLVMGWHDHAYRNRLRTLPQGLGPQRVRLRQLDLAGTRIFAAVVDGRLAGAWRMPDHLLRRDPQPRLLEVAIRRPAVEGWESWRGLRGPPVTAAWLRSSPLRYGLQAALIATGATVASELATNPPPGWFGDLIWGTSRSLEQVLVEPSPGSFGELAASWLLNTWGSALVLTASFVWRNLMDLPLAVERQWLETLAIAADLTGDQAWAGRLREDPARALVGAGTSQTARAARARGERAALALMEFPDPKGPVQLAVRAGLNMVGLGANLADAVIARYRPDAVDDAAREQRVAAALDRARQNVDRINSDTAALHAALMDATAPRSAAAAAAVVPARGVAAAAAVTAATGGGAGQVPAGDQDPVSGRPTGAERAAHGPDERASRGADPVLALLGGSAATSWLRGGIQDPAGPGAGVLVRDGAGPSGPSGPSADAPRAGAGPERPEGDELPGSTSDIAPSVQLQDPYAQVGGGTGGEEAASPPEPLAIVGLETTVDGVPVLIGLNGEVLKVLDGQGPVAADGPTGTPAQAGAEQPSSGGEQPGLPVSGAPAPGPPGTTAGDGLAPTSPSGTAAEDSPAPGTAAAAPSGSPPSAATPPAPEPDDSGSTSASASGDLDTDTDTDPGGVAALPG